MGNSCTSVFPNTGAWEQQDLNKTMGQTKTIRREALSMEKSKAARKKEVSTPYHYTLFFLIRWILTATSGTKPIIESAGHV